MKIVFAIPGLGFGGAERVVSILATQMAKKHKVMIILTSGNEERAYDITSEIEIKLLQKDKNNIARWLQFRKECKEYKADIVIAFMDAVGIMAACSLIFTGIPLITTERNDPSQRSRKLGFFFRVLKYISIPLTKGYVFQSEGAKHYYPVACQKKSTIILNPIEVDKLPLRENENVERTIVNVGRLHSQKNQSMLIAAFADSLFCRNGYVLQIYGEGELRLNLQQQIIELKLQDRVILEGNQKNVLYKIRNAAVFVLTSNYEGLPNALMEAMAIGIPSISTDCSPGGARMLIDPDFSNGIIVPCNNVSKLTEVMDDLFTNQELMNSIGNKAKKIVDIANVESVTSNWYTFIEKVLAE